MLYFILEDIEFSYKIKVKLYKLLKLFSLIFEVDNLLEH
jgi:hypothetical protein